MEDASLSSLVSPTYSGRVWLKAFWGFAPWHDGYLGFTRPGDRERFIRLCSPGDLVLIYGADNKLTTKVDRRQALGFLEVDATERISDLARASPEGRQRKIQMNVTDRWTHALPVRRAWKVNRRVEIGHLATETYTHEYARVIASQGMLVNPAEAVRVLALPVVPVNVYGEQEVTAGAEAAMSTYVPSRGIMPSFGPRTSEYVDGDAYLYMLQFEGDGAALLGFDRYALGRQVVVKVGYSSEPARRCSTHNAHLPPAAKAKWRLSLQSRAYPTGGEAKTAEDALKETFAAKFKSLGNEFFLGDPDELAAAFGFASAGAAFKISAGPARRK